jgi:2-keto-4-pentenoate hydratase/2-oxohepta-3-ene-1,7-dioic acid hydratase in catechol pathway
VHEFDGTEAEMVARVNVKERSRGNLRDLYYSWDAIVNRAALNTTLRVGDVIGSGTVGTDCILEHGDECWLEVGGVVELDVDGLGLLRSTVARTRRG